MVALSISYNHKSIPIILHQIRINIQFRGGYREDPSGGIVVGLEGPGIFPFSEADQVVSSPSFTRHFPGALSEKFFQGDGSIMVLYPRGAGINLVDQGSGSLAIGIGAAAQYGFC